MQYPICWDCCHKSQMRKLAFEVAKSFWKKRRSWDIKAFDSCRLECNPRNCITGPRWSSRSEFGRCDIAEQAANFDLWMFLQSKFSRRDLAKQPADFDLWTFFQSEFGRRDLAKQTAGLTFGYWFNQSLAGVALPSSLQTLSFPESFYLSAADVTLPSSFLVSGTTLPANLQTLILGDSFNQSLAGVALPSSLQTLSFPKSFYLSAADVALPSSFLFSDATLPANLQTLTLGDSFNQSFAAVTLQTACRWWLLVDVRSTRAWNPLLFCAVCVESLGAASLSNILFQVTIDGRLALEQYGDLQKKELASHCGTSADEMMNPVPVARQYACLVDVGWSYLSLVEGPAAFSEQIIGFQRCIQGSTP